MPSSAVATAQYVTDFDDEPLLDFTSRPAADKPDSTLARRLEVLDHLYAPHEGGIDRPGIDGLIGEENRCLFVKVLDSGDGERIAIPCGRWICRCCRENKIEFTARRYAHAFHTDGRPLVWEHFETRAKATNAVRYATNLGHAALVIPQSAGGAIVVTTQPRRRGTQIDNDRRELVLFLELMLSGVPAYTKDGGEHRVVNPNQVLRESLLSHVEFQQLEADERRSDMDDGARAALAEAYADRAASRSEQTWYWPTKSFDQTLEYLGLVESYGQWGHVRSYRVPDADTEPWAYLLFTEQRNLLKQAR